MVSTLTPRKARSLFPWRRDVLPNLRDDMEDILSRIWEGEPDAWFGLLARPSVDLSETDKTVDIRMDLPGVTPKDIDIKITGNVLTVSGERKEEVEEKGKAYHRVERRMGAFSRSFTLPCPVADDEVAAEYKDGVLMITLPKCEAAQARRIKIKA